MSKKSIKTFRLAFLRKRIRTTFKSEALRTALLGELDGGEDAALVIQMIERVRPASATPVQVVAPVPAPRNAAPPPCPVHGAAPPQPGPAQPQPNPVPPPADGNSRVGAVEVLDSDDELVQDLRLTPRRERRLRAQIEQWRNASSD